MNLISFYIAFPLDDSSFFRRECPLCRREFKVLTSTGEIGELSKRLVDNFLTDGPPFSTQSDIDEGEAERAHWCPYCNQTAPRTEWWTREQLACARMHAQNIVSDSLVQEMKDLSRSSSLLTYKGGELKRVTPWIPPEEDDMEVYGLPCCDDKIKLEIGMWDQQRVYSCFYCGFQHRLRRRPTV